MLFQYQGKPERLLSLFKSYRGLALRLREHSARFGRQQLGLSAVYLIVAGLSLAIWGSAPAAWFWLFAVAGLSYLLLAWGFCSVFRRFPSNRKTLGTRIGLGLSLLLASLVAIFGVDAMRQGLSGLTATAHGLGEIGLPWGLASLGVWIASRWITWLRLRNETIQEYELDFLDRLLNPLLRDLPPDAACTLACNPFAPMWSENFTTQDIGARRLKICDDVLLDFRAKLADESSLCLQTRHRRVDKYKIRKMKYKGTKHRLAMVFRLSHPALARLGEAQLQNFGVVCRQLESRPGKCATQVRRHLAEGKVVVVTKCRISASRDLAAGDLPPVKAALEPIHTLSAFVTGITA